MSFSPTFIIAILVAIAIHEWAHAWTAYRLGDPTAKEEGRLTLNPIAHLDPLGTILFLLVGFGWGKPVPVNPTYFKRFKRDNAVVSLAGPLSNLILAFCAVLFTIIITVSGFQEDAIFMRFLTELSSDILHVNLILMAFNLLPIAPLDGSKILHMFIPVRYEEYYLRFMQHGPYILLALIIAENISHISILSLWTGMIITPFMIFFSSMAMLL